MLKTNTVNPSQKSAGFEKDGLIQDQSITYAKQDTGLFWYAVQLCTVNVHVQLQRSIQENDYMTGLCHHLCPQMLSSGFYSQDAVLTTIQEPVTQDTEKGYIQQGKMYQYCQN